MARRIVRSLTPRLAAASRADRGQVSGPPDTSPSLVRSVVRSAMVPVASTMGASPATASQRAPLRVAGEDDAWSMRRIAPGAYYPPVAPDAGASTGACRG